MERLEKTIWPSDWENDNWAAGPTLEFVKKNVEYLLSDYDWRKYETLINQYPQFSTEIDNQHIHFLHVRSVEENATPLMLIHGWPGSFVEFLKVIYPLTNPVAYGRNASEAFHLVIPSLPGLDFRVQ